MARSTLVVANGSTLSDFSSSLAEGAEESISAEVVALVFP